MTQSHKTTERLKMTQETSISRWLKHNLIISKRLDWDRWWYWKSDCNLFWENEYTVVCSTLFTRWGLGVPQMWCYLLLSFLLLFHFDDDDGHSHVFRPLRLELPTNGLYATSFCSLQFTHIQISTRPNSTKDLLCQWLIELSVFLIETVFHQKQTLIYGLERYQISKQGDEKSH